MSQPTVGLFVTCLVNQFRPSVAWSAIDLLEASGCRVFVPTAQTCCGQPAFNSGDISAARGPARLILTAFASVDYVVAPSGSCAGMIRTHLADLFPADSSEHNQAKAVADKTWELTSFLRDVMRYQPAAIIDAGEALAYHDSCSGLRELGVRQQPRDLLAAQGVGPVRDLPDPDVCCGFGGTFCVKFPEVSTAIADEKIRNVEATGAQILAGGDLGCLMHLAGRIKRQNKPIRVFHTAEILADRMEQGSIAGAGETR